MTKYSAITILIMSVLTIGCATSVTKKPGDKAMTVMVNFIACDDMAKDFKMDTYQPFEIGIVGMTKKYDRLYHILELNDAMCHLAKDMKANAILNAKYVIHDNGKGIHNIDATGKAVNVTDKLSYI